MRRTAAGRKRPGLSNHGPTLASLAAPQRPPVPGRMAVSAAAGGLRRSAVLHRHTIEELDVSQVSVSPPAHRLQDEPEIAKSADLQRAGSNAPDRMIRASQDVMGDVWRESVSAVVYGFAHGSF